MKKLIGGLFDGKVVPNNSEDNSWFTVYSRNDKEWTPGHGVFVWDFPDGILSHGYRKKNDGQFHHVWTRNVGPN